MPLKIQVCGFSENVFSKQCIKHANDLSALFVNGNSIEIIYFNIGVRLNRVRHRTCILRKLVCAHVGRVLNPLYDRRVHIGRKLSIPKNREPFFKAELEPVSTRYPVARPIMEVLMSNNRFNLLKIDIARDIWVGKHTRGIEDV